MRDSILASVKQALGIDADYTAFDAELITHINSVFMILNQLGVGVEEGFYITDDSQVWSDFVPGRLNLMAVKSYTYLAVRIIWDPPTNSFTLESMNKLKQEFEWRLEVQA